MAAADYYRLDTNLSHQETPTNNNISQLPYQRLPGHVAEPLLEPQTQTAPATRLPQSLQVSDSIARRLQQRRLEKWKRYIRIIQAITNAISILFSSIMFASMAFITIKYISTESTTRDGKKAWPKNPKVWPTYMLLAASTVTVVLSIVTLISYCCNRGKAQRSWKLTLVKYVLHFCVWFIVSTLYRYEKSLHNVNNDLWGWSCASEADALQEKFNGVVNFSSLCKIQV